MSVEKDYHFVVADLHGSDEAFDETLSQLGAVDTSGAWVEEGASLTLLGDILADRNEGGLEIVSRIAELRPQIEKAGGELTVVAGNHELFALEYLGGHVLNTNIVQKVGYRELFRLAMGRDPVDDTELMVMPGKEDFIERLQEKAEAAPLLDFLARLKLFHAVEHEGGAKTLLLHAPPDLDALKLLLSPSRDAMNTEFQATIQAYLANEAGPLFPTTLSNSSTCFQWGEWFNCPKRFDPLWTRLATELGVTRVICGHRKDDEMVRSFGPVEAIALDRHFGIRPRDLKPEFWEGPVSGGILNKRGVFCF